MGARYGSTEALYRCAPLMGGKASGIDLNPRRVQGILCPMFRGRRATPEIYRILVRSYPLKIWAIHSYPVDARAVHHTLI